MTNKSKSSPNLYHAALFCLVLVNFCFIQDSLALSDEQKEAGLKISKFVEWMKYAEIEISKIKVAYIPGYGYGVKASQDIKKGERILKVPIDSMLLPSTATKSPAIGHVFDVIRMTPTHKSAVQLLFEKNNPTSFWKPYIDILQKNFSTSIYFSEKEMKEFEAAKIRDYSKVRKENAKKQYEATILPLLNEYPDIFSPAEAYSFEEFLWALSTIWSRAFTFKSKGDEGGLVPMGDMFNSIDGQTGEFLDKLETKITKDSMEYWTTQDIPKDEQIFTPYGRNKRLSNSQLLMDYGFVVVGNKNDMVLFENPVTDGEPYYKQKREYIDKLELRNQIPVYLKEYDQIFNAYRINFLQPTEFPLVDNIFKNQRVSLRNERQVVRALLTTVKKIADLYDTTIENDNHLLRTLDNSDENRNIRAAITIRKSEKEILQDLKKKLESLRINLNNEKDEDTPAKPTSRRKNNLKTEL